MRDCSLVSFWSQMRPFTMRTSHQSCCVLRQVLTSSYIPFSWRLGCRVACCCQPLVHLLHLAPSLVDALRLFPHYASSMLVVGLPDHRPCFLNQVPCVVRRALYHGPDRLLVVVVHSGFGSWRSCRDRGLLCPSSVCARLYQCV